MNYCGRGDSNHQQKLIILNNIKNIVLTFSNQTWTLFLRRRTRSRQAILHSTRCGNAKLPLLSWMAGCMVRRGPAIQIIVCQVCWGGTGCKHGGPYQLGGLSVPWSGERGWGLGWVTGPPRVGVEHCWQCPTLFSRWSFRWWSIFSSQNPSLPQVGRSMEFLWMGGRNK